MTDCIICLSEYTPEGPHVPYTISCGHSMCHKCLDSGIDQCPICRGFQKVSVQSSKKNHALIAVLESLASPKKKADVVCVDCNSYKLDTVKHRMMVCLTCSMKEDPGWLGKSSAQKKCLHLRLCEDCRLKNHATPEHSLKELVEVKSVIAAMRCSELLAENVTNFYPHVQLFIGCDEDAVESFKEVVEVAISYLKNWKRGDEKCVTSLHISDAIESVQPCLDSLIETHRVQMNKIKKATFDLKSRLPMELFDKNEESEMIVRGETIKLLLNAAGPGGEVINHFDLPKIMENDGATSKRHDSLDLTPSNGITTTAGLMKRFVSSDAHVVRDVISELIDTSTEAVDNTELLPKSKQYVIAIAICNTMNPREISPFLNRLRATLRREFGSSQRIIKEESLELALAIRTRLLGIMRVVTVLFAYELNSHRTMIGYFYDLLILGIRPFNERHEIAVSCACECLNMIQESERFNEVKPKYNKFVERLNLLVDDLPQTVRCTIKNMYERWNFEKDDDDELGEEDDEDDVDDESGEEVAADF